MRAEARRQAKERARQRQAEEALGRSLFLQLVREEWLEDRNILFLHRMVETSPSAAQLLGQWRVALDQLRKLGQHVTVAVADGRALAACRDDATAAPAEVATLLQRCGLETVQPPRRSVLQLLPWFARHFRCVDRFAPGPVPRAVTLASSRALDALRFLAPLGDFEPFLAQRHLVEKVQREAAQRREAHEEQALHRTAAEALLAALEKSDRPSRSDFGLPTLALPGVASSRAARLLRVREAWTLLGLDAEQGREAASRELVQLIWIGQQEFVGTITVADLLADRDAKLAPILDSMLVAPWEMAAILGVGRRSVRAIARLGHLAVRGQGSPATQPGRSLPGEMCWH